MNLVLPANAKEAIGRLQSPEATNSAAVLVCNVKTNAVEMQQYYDNTTLEKVRLVAFRLV